MSLDDSLRRREPHARAFELLVAMQPVEDAEQLVLVLHVEARAVVGDAIDDVRPVYDRGYRDARIVAPARILDRIADQVQPDLLQQRGVASRARERQD